MKRIHIFILLSTLFSGLNAQDIEKVLESRKADPLQITGSVGLQAGGTEAYGITTQRPPFYWSARANLNLKFFDLIDAPLSFSYSPQGSNFDYPFNRQLPFNQLGISPRYKSVTVHLGYRSMQISKYSMAGTSFNGVGVEWKPKKNPWEISGLFGKIAQAVTDTTLIDQPGISLFNRYGMATKVKYKTKKGNYAVHLFKAYDNENSSLIPVGGLEENAPKENLITGVAIEQQLLKKVNFKLELVRSAYTMNKNSTEVRAVGTDAVYNPLGFIYQSRLSSVYSGVIDGSLNWTSKIVNLQLAYKKIASDYLNLGSPFFNNDLEVGSVGLSRRFLKNKLSLNTNVGIQRNNLDDSQLDKTNRLALNGTVSYSPFKRWTMNGTYSNFTTNTTQIRINELDSLAFYQVSENRTINTTVRLGEKMKQNIGLSVSNQLVRDLEDVTSRLYNASVSFGGLLEKVGLRQQVRVNYIRNELTELQELTQGGGASVSLSKSFFKKKLNTRCSYNEIWFYEGSERIGRNNTVRLTGTVRVKKAHGFNVSLSWLERQKLARQTSGEFQYQIGYTYNFGVKDIVKKKSETEALPSEK